MEFQVSAHISRRARAKRGDTHRKLPALPSRSSSATIFWRCPLPTASHSHANTILPLWLNQDRFHFAAPNYKSEAASVPFPCPSLPAALKSPHPVASPREPSAAQNVTVIKTCMQCGAINGADASACCCCDARLSGKIPEDIFARASLPTRMPTPLFHPRSDQFRCQPKPTRRILRAASRGAATCNGFTFASLPPESPLHHKMPMVWKPIPTTIATPALPGAGK